MPITTLVDCSFIISLRLIRLAELFRSSANSALISSRNFIIGRPEPHFSMKRSHAAERQTADFSISTPTRIYLPANSSRSSILELIPPSIN